MSRSRSSSSSRSSYRHVKCAKGNCDKERAKFQNSGHGKYSIYCKRHSCHAGYGCKTLSESGERFCSNHAQCSHPGCGKRVLQEDASFAYSKMKAATPSQEWWFCSDHRCKTKDCWRYRRSSKTKHCDEHADENQCEAPDCSSDRTSKHYCDKHSCQQPNCTRQTFATGRDIEKCDHHQPCASPGCTQHVDLDANNSPEEFCPYHCRCYMRGCNALVQTGSTFCAEHECYMQNCRRERDLDRASDTKYCNRHRCRVMNCRNSVRESDGYSGRLCSWHTCQRAGCSERSRTDKFNSPYCITHRCANKSCLGEAKIPNGYCLQDSCALPYCGLPKTSPLESYCINHGPPPALISHSTSPTIGISRSSSRHNSPGRNQGTHWLPWAPHVPQRMSVVVESSPITGSRDQYYAQADRQFRNQRRGC